MRGINYSPRAAGASPVVPDQDGAQQGKVARLTQLFECVGVQSANKLSQGPVGELGQGRLQVFQKDPRIGEAVALIHKVQQALGEPIEGEPAYSSLFEQTTINTIDNCIATLKDLKQWIIYKRLLHGSETYKSEAKDHCRNNSNFSETAIIKSATATEANGLYEKLKLSEDEKTKSFQAIIDSNAETIRNILSSKLKAESSSYKEDVKSIDRISRNLTHCGLVEKIDALLNTLSEAATDPAGDFVLHLGPDVMNGTRGAKDPGPSNE
ncbi:MAG: hypothetical protein ISQ13_04330 [Candidatus Margulisbacteria bacterium]|nr:hypothetical protein [Candidatus Margulisiibacteriota bacterium]